MMESDLSKAPEIGGDKGKLGDILDAELIKESDPSLVFSKVVVRAIQEAGYHRDNADKIIDDINHILRSQDSMVFLNFATEWFRKSREILRVIFSVYALEADESLN